jgi:5-methylcytosine-specific restriction endonuclease McrA
MYTLDDHLKGRPKPLSPSERKANRKREENLKRRLAQEWTEEEWQALCFVWGYRCAYCLEKLPLTRDHVVPIGKGGSNSIRNMVPACYDCNQNKGAKLHDPRPRYLPPSMEQALGQLPPRLREALGLG